MRYQVAAAVAVGVLVGTFAGRAGAPPDARAQQPPPPAVEYKVVFSPVAHVELRESRQVDGKVKEIVHGPRASAAAMTEQFNALAAEGWEYVGPVAPTGRPAAGDGASGVLTLFKRAKR